MGSLNTVGYDIDPDALEIAQRNCDEMDVPVDFVLCNVAAPWYSSEERRLSATKGHSGSSDVSGYTIQKGFKGQKTESNPSDAERHEELLSDSSGDTSFFPSSFPLRHGCVDTVIMNPPFGTKKGSEGVDMKFLQRALAIATTAVYCCFS